MIESCYKKEMFSCGYFVENIEEPPSFEEPLSLSKNTPSSFFGSEERRTPPHPRSSDFEDRRPSRDGNDTPGVEVDRRLTDHLQLRETCTSFFGREARVAWFQERSESRVAWFRERFSFLGERVFSLGNFSANPSDFRIRPIPQVFRFPLFSNRLCR